MGVPKTAMYEYNRTVLGKDEIRLARQFLRMDPKPKTKLVQKASYYDFGFGVLRPNSAHIITSNLRLMHIRHGSKLHIPVLSVRLNSENFSAPADVSARNLRGMASRRVHATAA